jgi:hypothetical protein
MKRLHDSQSVLSSHQAHQSICRSPQQEIWINRQDECRYKKISSIFQVMGQYLTNNFKQNRDHEDLANALPAVLD